MDNGEHVTRAEMGEALKPIREDVWEIKADVKFLLIASANAKGAQKVKSHALSLIISLCATGAAVCALVLTALYH